MQLNILTLNLTFQLPVFAYANTGRKRALDIHFMYSGNKKIYCNFKRCCIISILFSTKCHLFHIFISLYLNNKFSVSCVLMPNHHSRIKAVIINVPNNLQFTVGFKWAAVNRI